MGKMTIEEILQDKQKFQHEVFEIAQVDLIKDTNHIEKTGCTNYVTTTNHYVPLFVIQILWYP